MSQSGIVSGSEEGYKVVKKERKFGGASCFSGCLSLQAGFVSILFWSLLWSFLLLLLYFVIWKVTYYTDWLVDIVGQYFTDEKDPASSEHLEVLDSTKRLLGEFELWVWWSTWVEGILLFGATALGCWGIGGCCMGSTSRRLRQNSLILASCWLLFFQWMLGTGIIISFPIWLRVSKRISIFSWKLALCYTFFLVIPVFCGGFWMLDAAFSYYYVLRAGGTGLEMKSANEIKKDKEAPDDLVDDLDELRVRQPLIHRNFAPDGFQPVFEEDLESMGNCFENGNIPIKTIGIERQ